jgi:hypothetical protein
MISASSLVFGQVCTDATVIGHLHEPAASCESARIAPQGPLSLTLAPKGHLVAEFAPEFLHVTRP